MARNGDIIFDRLDTRRRAEAGEIALGTIDAWLIFKLTGGEVHATDVTNASRTMLLNLKTLEWDAELLKLFGVSRKALPEVRDSAGDFGGAASAAEVSTAD